MKIDIFTIQWLRATVGLIMFLSFVMTAQVAANTITFDSAGRLVTVVRDDGSTTSFDYDATGNLTRKRVVRPGFTVAITNNPVGGGTSTGSGSYASASNVTVAASASVGYVFSNWSGYSACTVQGATCTFTMPAQAVNLVANFVPTGTPTFNLTVTAGAGGTTSPTGTSTRAQGAQVTILAAPNPLFAFSAWSSNSLGCGTNPSCTFTMPSSAVTLSASFATCSYSFTPPTLSSVASAGVTNSSFTVTPQPANCAIPAPVATSTGNWLSATINGNTVSYSASQNGGATDRIGTIAIGSQSISVTQVGTAATTYTLSVSAGAGGATSPSGASQRTSGESITVTATANSGYGFANWTGYAGCGASASCTFAMPSTAVTLTANFTAMPACTYSFNPTSVAALGPASATGSFTVVTQLGCAIAAPVVSATGGWLGATLSGSTVNFTVTQNTGSAVRTGTITVGALVLTITQGGAGGAGSCGLGYPLGNWRTFGTASLVGSTLTVGDNISYDPSDSDGDCNPEAYIYTASTAVDSEWAVYSQSYTQPISFSWTGCIGSTAASYMGVGLAFVNPLFTGAQSSNQLPVGQWDVVFMTRWENPGKLFVYSTETGTYVGTQVAAATSSGSGMCGTFEVRSGGGTASAYFNGTLVQQVPSVSTLARVPYVRSYDKPVTVVNAVVGAVPFTDTTPDAFSFVAQSAVALNAPITSNTITITGINSPSPITVTGGSYSLGCTATFTGAAGTVNNGQTVCVRHTSSGASGMTVATTLTVGGVASAFTSTTIGLTCSVDVVGSGTPLATPDGLLLLRYMLGFRGNVLTEGLSISAPRSAIADIEAFLAASDYSATGTAGRPTNVDGLIFLRLLQGVPDSALLNGINVPAGAAFRDAAAIRANVNARCGTAF